jgi:hypothetical protein
MAFIRHKLDFCCMFYPVILRILFDYLLFSLLPSPRPNETAQHYQLLDVFNDLNNLNILNHSTYYKACKVPQLP